MEDGAYLSGAVRIERGARVMRGAIIEGPTIVGENCVVRPGAYLRGNVVLGSGVLIGHGTEVKGSIVLSGASMAHFSYVGDSVIGGRVLIGAGVKLANARLDQGLIAIATPDGAIKTGLRRLGSVVGDRASIGCNAVLNPGSVIASRAHVPPLHSVRGWFAGVA